MADADTPMKETKAAPAKIDAAAEKAYAEAAAKKVSTTKVDAPAIADLSKPVAAVPAAAKPAPAKKVAVKKAPAAKAAGKRTATGKTAAAKKVAAKKPKAVSATPAKTKNTASTNPVTKLKDTIMATAAKTDITATAKELLADVQTRAKTAFAKTSELTAEASEFTKANVEAVVESGKIFFTGAQELLKDNVETGKTVIETVTEDAKKMAAMKSPTELMQLQGELARRNFDAAIAFGSKRTEQLVKLANDTYAPISNRVSLAAEKISKAA